jgi:hypothetical protein
MLSRARSNVCVRSAVLGAGAAISGAGVDGTSVRCGGVGGGGAGSGGVAAGAGCCGVVRGGAGLAGGAVTVIRGTGVMPGDEGGVPAGGCCTGCELGGVSPGVADGPAGAGADPDPGAGAGLGAGVAGGAASGGCGCEGATVSVQLSQNSDELLRRSKRLLRLDIPAPDSFSCENVPSHRCALRSAQAMRRRECAQATGGARAEKNVGGEAIQPNFTVASGRHRPRANGSGMDGGSAKATAPTRCMSAQIAQ